MSLVVAVMDDGEAFGPFDSPLDALRAVIHALAADSRVLKEYREPARRLDDIKTWQMPELIDAKSLIHETDYVIYEIVAVVPTVGALEAIFGNDLQHPNRLNPDLYSVVGA